MPDFVDHRLKYVCPLERVDRPELGVIDVNVPSILQRKKQVKDKNMPSSFLFLDCYLRKVRMGQCAPRPIESVAVPMLIPLEPDLDSVTVSLFAF